MAVALAILAGPLGGVWLAAPAAVDSLAPSGQTAAAVRSGGPPPDIAIQVPASASGKALAGFFTANEGQVADPDVMYYVRSPTLDVSFAPGGVFLTFHPGPGTQERASAVRMAFAGASQAVPVAREPAEFATNFFIGDDRTSWHSGVASYGSIEYRDLYPRIDLVFRMTDSGLKYDFVVAPGADLEQVAFSFEGSAASRIDSEGHLVVSTAAGPFRDDAPTAFQGDDSVDCAFVQRGPATYGFQCAPWDRSRPLTVDPLIWATYMGGLGFEFNEAIALDPSGNIFIAGNTSAYNFPVTAGAFDTTLNGVNDTYLVKLDATGQHILWASFFGGLAEDSLGGLAVDRDGNPVIAGETFSLNFPISPGAYSGTRRGLTDAFVAKFAANGTGVTFSTLLGGSGWEQLRGLAVAADGSPVVAGTTESTDFPTTAGAWRTTFSAVRDSFVARLSSDGTNLTWATYIGGEDIESAWDVAVDDSDRVFVAGYTQSTDFLTTSGAAQETFAGGSDAFILALEPNGTGPVFSTFLGGTGFDTGWSIGVDGAGDPYVAGWTYSTDFPTTPGAFDRTYGGDADPFAAKFSGSDGSLVYSTLLGGSGIDNGYGIAVDRGGNATVVGHTYTTDFPVTPGAGADSMNGLSDAFVVVLNPSGSNFTFAQLSGGSRNDVAFGAALGTNGTIYLVGDTESKDFPVSPDAPDASADAYSESFVARIDTAAARFNITFETDPPGLVLDLAGTVAQAPITIPCWNGSRIWAEGNATLYGPGTRYSFSGWSDGGQRGHVVPCASDGTLVATFDVDFLVNVSSSPPGLQLRLAGASSSSNLSVWLGAGQSVSLQADTPQTVGGVRYALAGWSDGGAPTHTVSVDGPMELVATFDIDAYEVRISTEPSGLQVHVDGTSTSGGGSFWWAPGSSHDVAAPANLSASAGSRWSFTNWSDGSPRMRTVVAAGPLDLSARFEHEYEFVLSTDPPGYPVSVDGETAAGGSFWWPAGSSHSFWAPQGPQDGPDPDARMTFSGWLDGPSADRVEVVDRPLNLTALYRPSQYRVVIRTSPGDFPLTVDGTSVDAPASFWWAVGSEHTVAPADPVPAGPDTRFRFSQWDDKTASPRTLRVFGAITLLASYLTEYHANITSTYGHPACDVPDCWYPGGALASVSMETLEPGPPGVRHTFTSWGGAASGNATPLSLRMDGPRAITAAWTTEYLLTVVSQFGDATGGGWYPAGSVAEFAVTRDPGVSTGEVYRFEQWRGDAESFQANASVNMDGPKTVTAVWVHVSSEVPQDTAFDLFWVAVAAAAGGSAVAGVLWARRRGSRPPDG